ncbi:MAG TPA: MMPL family transporter [Candidatus Nanopelagicales bacterium]|nr:MMPL family transporter [Candidatus Nanopelagicales bacterium]
MTGVSRWAVRHPVWGLISWVLIMVLVGILGTVFAGKYNDSFELPDTESTKAQELLTDLPGGGAGFDDATGKIVWKAESGAVTDPATATTVTAMLTEISKLPGVDCVQTPYGDPLGVACPADQTGTGNGAGQGEGPDPTAGLPQTPEAKAALAAAGPVGVSPTEPIAYGTVTFHGAVDKVPVGQIAAVKDVLEAQNGKDGLIVGANGNVFAFVMDEEPPSEGIGVIVALVILLFAFGSLLAAFLPILSAVIALGSGLVLVSFVARFFDVATFAPTLAAMIGLGVGIDYSLFVINRFREAMLRGRDQKAAATEAVNTSGRAVQFAAITVIIALLGLFVLNINFFNGLALASAFTVLMVALGALILLPAVLSLLGPKAFAGRMAWVSEDEALNKARRTGGLHAAAKVLRWIGWLLVLPVTIVGWLYRKATAARRAAHAGHGNAFARYGNWLQRRPWLTGIAALVVLVVVALPAASLRLGFPDDSGSPAGSTARIAYDLTAEGFGAGVNGPFFIAQEFATPGAQNVETFGKLVGALNQTAGVAVAVGLPPATDVSATAIQVVPTSAPQDEATTDLLGDLRENVIPTALNGTDSQAYVGGTQAITTDFTTVLAGALPWFLLIVVGLGFLALVVLFRSILLPLMGVATSLLSLAASVGVTVAVFQWGWFKEIVGITSTGPIVPFMPIMVFAILFGLSMDYQVFLVSRMQEEWAHTGDNRAAIRRGLAGSGRVVAIAAAIMTSVFAAFILGSNSFIKLFGVALSTAVLFDAFVNRLVLIPSLMTIIGKANWWLPGWLDKIIPHVSHEAEADMEAGDQSIEDVPEAELDPV